MTHPLTDRLLALARAWVDADVEYCTTSRDDTDDGELAELQAGAEVAKREFVAALSRHATLLHEIGDLAAAVGGNQEISAMSEIVRDLARRNWSDEKIGRELGMEPDEVLRLKQISGLAELLRGVGTGGPG